MNLLFDTHVLLWWFGPEPGRLSMAAKKAIESPGSVLYFSAASVWEIATKHRIGRLPLPPKFLNDLPALLQQQQILSLPISLAHARAAGPWSGDHKDPFDRMLAAQAQIEGLTLLTSDKAFKMFEIETLW